MAGGQITSAALSADEHRGDVFVQQFLLFCLFVCLILITPLHMFRLISRVRTLRWSINAAVSARLPRLIYKTCSVEFVLWAETRSGSHGHATPPWMVNTRRALIRGQFDQVVSRCLVLRLFHCCYKKNTTPWIPCCIWLTYFVVGGSVSNSPLSGRDYEWTIGL